MKKNTYYITTPIYYVNALSILSVCWFTIIGVSMVLSSWGVINAEQAVFIADVAWREDSLIRIARAEDMDKRRRIHEPVFAKGIYLTAATAGSKRVNDFIELIRKTEINAVVIDIKDYSGWVSYDSNAKMANTLHTERVLIKNLPELLSSLKSEDIYTIARIQVFQDPVLAERRPDLAIQNKGGGVWKDFKGLAWLDPGSREVWDYTIELAKDAIEKGFDEVNFDYIRFPSDGRIGEAVYTHTAGRSKIDTINDFFAYLNESLKDEPAFISADLFGMTLWSSSDFNIGQTLLGAASYFDYISPMVYTSHYADGFDGYANPALYPYEIVSKNLKKGILTLEAASSTANLRPWLQDFDLGATYTHDMVRAQIRAAEELKTSGWFLWNASNNYTTSALAEDSR